jgi:hypothetical protein
MDATRPESPAPQAGSNIILETKTTPKTTLSARNAVMDAVEDVIYGSVRDPLYKI